MLAEWTPEQVAEWVAESPWILVGVALLAEELACLVAGILVVGSGLSAGVALTACWLGTVVGDVFVWGAGRLCTDPLLSWPRLQRVFTPALQRAVRVRVAEQPGRLVMSARMVPGLRLPIFFGLGAAKLSARRFLPWLALIDGGWVLAVVALGVLLGEASLGWLEATSWVSVVALTVIGLALVRAIRRPASDAPEYVGEAD